MKNIKIENAKRNAVIAFGPDRKQARVRTVKGEPGLYEVVILGDGGAHREFKKGETVSVGTPADIKNPAICDGEGRGIHLDPEVMWWTPTETKPYCRKCAGARNREIAAAKRNGTWVPQGKRFRDPVSGDLTEAGRAKVQRAMEIAQAGASATREEMFRSILRNNLNSTSLRKPRKGEQESYNAARIATLIAEWGLTRDEVVAFAPEIADVPVRTWAEHRADFPKRAAKVEEEEAA